MHEHEDEEKANKYVTPCDGNQNESQTQSAGTDSDDDDELDTDYIIKHIDIEDDIQKPTASPDEQRDVSCDDEVKEQTNARKVPVLQHKASRCSQSMQNPPTNHQAACPVMIPKPNVQNPLSLSMPVPGAAPVFQQNLSSANMQQHLALQRLQFFSGSGGSWGIGIPSSTCPVLQTPSLVALCFSVTKYGHKINDFTERTLF